MFLGGFDLNLFNLVSYFFSVVFFGIGRFMVSFSTFERLFKGGNILVGVCKIIFLIVKGEGFICMFFLVWFRMCLGII